MGHIAPHIVLHTDLGLILASDTVVPLLIFRSVYTVQPTVGWQVAVEKQTAWDRLFPCNHPPLEPPSAHGFGLGAGVMGAYVLFIHFVWKWERVQNYGRAQSYGSSKVRRSRTHGPLGSISAYTFSPFLCWYRTLASQHSPVKSRTIPSEYYQHHFDIGTTTMGPLLHA